MTKVPRLSIVVVSFNTCRLTLECLRSIERETVDTSYEVIVVDNASADGSADSIASSFPHMKLIRSPENLGFARANNLAAREARGEFLLLLNPDTVVLDRALDRLVAFALTHREAGIWGGRTLFGNRSLNPSSCWRRMTIWNQFCCTTGLRALFPGSALFSSESYGGWARDGVRQVDIVSGCLFLISRALWNELGGFDPVFFMYGEEADLCLRSRSRGIRPMVTPEATIIHYGSASEPVRAEKDAKVLAAKITLVQRHWSPSLRWIGRSLLTLAPLTRAFSYSIGALLLRRPKLVEKGRLWRDVWSLRGLWVHGMSSRP